MSESRENHGGQSAFGGSQGGCDDRSGGGSNAAYSFGAATGTTVGSTLTETITSGNRVTTIVYTETAAATATAPAQFKIASNTSANAPTYSFTAGAGGTTNLVETVTTSTGTNTLTYAGGTQLSESLVTIASPTTTLASGAKLSYGFTTTAGVTSLTETIARDSITTTYKLSVDPTTVFAAPSATTETQTSVHGNSVVTVSYTNTGSGFAVASTDTLYIAQGAALTALDVEGFDRAHFTITGTSTSVTPVNASGTSLTAFTAASNNTFVAVTPATLPSGLPAAGSFVQETITNGTHVNNVLFYSATGASGIYTEIAHGTTIDLVGVATQLAKLPAAEVALL
jgi:hypothetical protein